VLESISQIDGQIVIKFWAGPDDIETKAEEVLHAVSGVPGVVTAAIDRLGSVPQR